MMTPYSPGLTCSIPLQHSGPYFQNNGTCNSFENVANVFLRFVPCPPPFMNEGEFRSNVSRLNISEQILLAIIIICNISAEPETTTTPYLTRNYLTNIELKTATSDFLHTATENQATTQRHITNIVTHQYVTKATFDFSTTTTWNNATEQIQRYFDKTIKHHVTALANQEGTVAGICLSCGFLVLVVIMYRKRNANTGNRHQQDSNHTDLRMRSGIDIPQCGTLKDTYADMHVYDVIEDAKDETSQRKDDRL